MKHMMIFDNYVKESIKELILEVSVNPLIYFSEKSLQVRLAMKLISYLEFSTPIQTNLCERYKRNIKKLGSEKSYLINALSVAPLQMEYGINEPGPYRVDIAILDPNEIKLIDNWQFQIGEKYLNPLIAIEIGTEKSGAKNMCKIHFENDAFKLKNSKKGYILNVMRNFNVGQKHKKRFQKKLSQLEEFKNSLKSMSSKYANINWIGLIIHIAHQEVEFFDINNVWKTFKIPSIEFEKAINNKL